jgi:hypothetical protein
MPWPTFPTSHAHYLLKSAPGVPIVVTPSANADVDLARLVDTGIRLSDGVGEWRPYLSSSSRLLASSDRAFCFRVTNLQFSPTVWIRSADQTDIFIWF